MKKINKKFLICIGIDIIAIDIYGKTKMAKTSLSVTTPDMIIEALQYPIMTTKGIVNTKYTNPSDPNDFYYELDLNRNCTAEDALDKAAYDGDDSTYYDGTSAKKKFYFGNDIDIYNVCLKIDSNYNGIIYTGINVKGNISAPSEVKFIDNGICHTTYYGKNSRAWRNFFSEINCKLYEIYYDSNIE